MLKPIVAILGLFLTCAVHATPLLPLTEAYPQVTKVLERLNLQDSLIKEAPMEGFIQVEADKGILYISHDGRFIIQGTLYQMKKEHFENVTQKAVFEQLNAMQDEMIVYRAKDEKATISVFIDITCGYCHQLHQDVEALNEAGITVRFLAFPRSGPDSDSAKAMAKAWCATDAQQALNQLIDGEIADSDGSECDKVIRKQYLLGHRMNINGTPAIILDNGQILPGYQPVDVLKSIINQERSHD